MRTREEIHEERKKLKDQLIEIDKELCRHPDEIRDAFKHNPLWDMEAFEALAQRVSFIKWTISDSWDGCTIQLDDQVYRLSERKGSPTINFGPICDGEVKLEALDNKVIRALWQQDDPIAYLREKSIEDHMMVGYLLAISLEG